MIRSFSTPEIIIYENDDSTENMERKMTYLCVQMWYNKLYPFLMDSYFFYYISFFWSFLFHFLSSYYILIKERNALVIFR